jgi:hypothetical protein
MLTWTGPQPKTPAVDPADLILFECGICDCYHPWEFAGDCRDDSNRFGSPEEYAAKMGVADVEVRSMDDRVQADLEGE